VPGVSGGTIAFVTGIYDELISTLSGFNFRSVEQLFTDPPAFWRDHNLAFLAWLGAGMLVSIGLFARLLKAALEHTPTLVWGFFFGLIAVSVVMLGMGRKLRPLVTLGTVGVIAGLLVSRLSPGHIESGPLIFFLGGMVAVCAWLLPAVSGSFVLLVIGIYEGVLDAIAGFQMGLLVALAAGCAVGILLFSKLLGWLMARYMEPVLCVLTGFMLGAMVKLWPWRVDNSLYLPQGWEALTSQNPMLLETLGCMIAGGAMLLFLTTLKK
ncbi:MAG: DUF368 domain-containing protein, partial [Proteobacteria bacterium]|nr:DUF368 domain-containing protein [Pseudomonadota bacterium]